MTDSASARMSLTWTTRRLTAIAGAGIVQVLHYIAAPAIAQGQLVPVLQKYTAPGETISDIYPPCHYLSTKSGLSIASQTSSAMGACHLLERNVVGLSSSLR